MKEKTKFLYFRVLSKRFFSWYAVFFYSLFIICISIISPKAFLHLPYLMHLLIFDKILHFFMYFLLSFIVTNTLFLKKKENLQPQAISFSYAFSLGLILEITQFFMPFRSFETADIFSNFLGSLIGCLLKIV